MDDARRPVAAPWRHPVLVGAVLIASLAACGAEPVTQDASEAEIPFTPEERSLLESPDTIMHPSGPVSRENYRQQLEALEKEVATEASR